MKYFVLEIEETDQTNKSVLMPIINAKAYRTAYDTENMLIRPSIKKPASYQKTTQNLGKVHTRFKSHKRGTRSLFC